MADIILANNNKINNVGVFPMATTISLENNRIDKLIIPDNISYLNIASNDISEIKLSKLSLKNIKELHLDFKTYSKFYKDYYNNIGSISVQINKKKLTTLLNKLGDYFDENNRVYIFRKFIDMNFVKRNETIKQIALKIHYDKFPLNGIKTIDQIYNTNEYKHIVYTVDKVYHKTIVIFLFFNGYRN
jgi:hypothetical protein